MTPTLLAMGAWKALWLLLFVFVVGLVITAARGKWHAHEKHEVVCDGVVIAVCDDEAAAKEVMEVSRSANPTGVYSIRPKKKGR